jgi:rubrerythrin
MGTKAHRRARGRAFSEDEKAVQDVGAQIEGAADAPSAPPPPPLDDSGFAEFSVTGTAVSGEFRCSDCGYGAVVRRALPPCPMCGSTVWESRPPRFVD